MVATGDTGKGECSKPMYREQRWCACLHEGYHPVHIGTHDTINIRMKLCTSYVPSTRWLPRATSRSPPRNKQKRAKTRACTPSGAEHLMYVRWGLNPHLSLRAVGHNVPPPSAAQAAGLVRSGPQLVLPFPRFVRPAMAAHDDVGTHAVVAARGWVPGKSISALARYMYVGARSGEGGIMEKPRSGIFGQTVLTVPEEFSLL